MQKTNEIRIMTYKEDGHEYIRAIIYDNKTKEWRELGRGLDIDVYLLCVCANDVMDKYNRGVKIAKK